MKLTVNNLRRIIKEEVAYGEAAQRMSTFISLQYEAWRQSTGASEDQLDAAVERLQDAVHAALEEIEADLTTNRR